MIKAVIIDDEPAVSKIIKYFIKKENIPIEIIGIAEDGQLGIELIMQKDPDIVFLDIQMPKKNGFEVMKSVPSMKYIIITAYESFDYAQQALRLGACDIILKPIEYNQFIDAIERSINFKFTSNANVNLILDYIHKNYSSNINLTELADIFFLTPSYMARLFKKHTNTTIINYIHQIRIEKSKELLSKNVYSVKEVAKLSGYYSLNNFYKYFNMYTEMTPGEYGKFTAYDKDNR